MHTQENDILFLPQEAFFLKIADLPGGMAQSEIGVWAETTLESFSPLALDLLRWGYCADSGQALIFAASAERLAKNQKNAAAMGSARVATCFAAFVFGMDLGEGWSLLKRECGDFCEYLAVKIEGGKWREICAASLPCGGGDEAAVAKFAKMGVSGKIERVLDFSFEAGNPFKPAEVLLEGGGASITRKIKGFKFYSAADVRDSVSLKSARKAIFAGKAALALAVLACAFFAALVFWKISLLFQASRLNALQAEAGALSPQAELVMNMMDEAAFLRALHAKKVENVMMLAKINKCRPEGVSFSKSASRSPNSIEIKGKAQSVMLATQFERALKASEDFKNVKLAISGSGSGGTSWTLNADFK